MSILPFVLPGSSSGKANGASDHEANFESDELCMFNALLYRIAKDPPLSSKLAPAGSKPVLPRLFDDLPDVPRAGSAGNLDKLFTATSRGPATRDLVKQPPVSATCAPSERE